MQVAIGRGDDAHIHGGRRRRAHAIEGLFLQHAEQFALVIQPEITDFVQKDRAVIGQFEIAAPVGSGAGETAFRMAEEFAFKQLRRDGRHVDGNEGFAGSGAEPVDRAGEEFLAGARFSEQQHGQGRSGAFLQIPEQAQKRRVSGDDAELPAFDGQLVERGVAEGAGFVAGGAQIMQLPLQPRELLAGGLFLCLHLGQFGPQRFGGAGEILSLTG